MNYKINDKLVAIRDYLDLFKKEQEYKIYQIEDHLGVLTNNKKHENFYYLSDDVKKISEWGLQEYELDIHFKKL